jgi:hypothetical protein
MGVHRISLVTDPVLRAVIHNAKSTRKKGPDKKGKREKKNKKKKRKTGR